MDDFKILVKILAAVIACEEHGFSMDYFSEKVIGADEAKRDRFTYKLYKEGLIDGIVVLDELNGVYGHPIAWRVSHPEITIKGMEFLRENKSARSAIDNIKNIAAGAASAAIQAIIAGL